MSIILKGIDLPKEGRLKIEITSDGLVWIDTGRRFYAHKDYAIQIDRPHGRIVDADDIKAKCINEVFDSMGTVAITDPYPDDEWADDICDVPTILDEEGK